jgi:glucose-6-phosphate 1-dehydrogenase
VFWRGGHGDATLFQRADPVEAAWRAVQGLLDAWAGTPADDFPNYAAGSAGPEVANRLLARDGCAWLPIGAHLHGEVNFGLAASRN